MLLFSCTIIISWNGVKLNKMINLNLRITIIMMGYKRIEFLRYLVLRAFWLFQPQIIYIIVIPTTE